MTNTDRIREYEQPGFNLGMLVGEQERVALATHNGDLRSEMRELTAENLALLADNLRLQGIVDRAIRYVKHTDHLAVMAARGHNVFGKRWMEITGFKPQPAKDAT